MIVTLKQCTVELYKHIVIPHFYHSVVVLIIWCASISQFHTTFLPLCRCSHYMVYINISVSYQIYTTRLLFSLYGVYQYLSFISHFYHYVIVLIIWFASISQSHTTFLPLCHCSHYMVCINISVSYHISTTLSLFSLYGVHQYLSFIPHFYHSVVVLIIWGASLFQFPTTFLPLCRCSHYMVCINISVSVYFSF